MPYSRIRVKPQNARHTTATSLMAKSGVNLRDLPQLMSPDFALQNENYFVTTDGGLSKRKGLIELTTVAGNKPVTLLDEWKGYYIFGYETTVAAYNPDTGTVTNIKTNWSTNAPFSGGSYGDYFFVGNTGNKIHYITEAAGVFTITEIAAAPLSGVIRPIGPRLYAGVGTDVYYCSVDTGSNPPFTNWTVAATATAAGIVSFRNAGTVRSICSLGDIIVAFGDTGKYAFRITTQNDGTGTIVKLEEVVIDRVDMGGASGAITTPKGLFYVNKSGLWQLISLGQPNIPFSDQEGLTSVLLGTGYFDNVTLDNCDLTYYARFNSVLVTCAKASSRNNHVLTYNTENKAFSVFKNWNINRWMVVSGEVYGGSAVKTTLYSCFNGNSDDGVPIATSYIQEMRCGELWTRQMLYGAYIDGKLHPLSAPVVAFDIYNVRGELEENKLSFTWRAGYNVNTLDGWGKAEYGKSSWGGDVDTSGTLESFAGMHQFIRNFQRIRIHITEGSELPHEITWFSLDARAKANIRRRNLELTTPTANLLN